MLILFLLEVECIFIFLFFKQLNQFYFSKIECSGLAHTGTLSFQDTTGKKIEFCTNISAM